VDQHPDKLIDGRVGNPIAKSGLIASHGTQESFRGENGSKLGWNGHACGGIGILGNIGIDEIATVQHPLDLFANAAARLRPCIPAHFGDAHVDRALRHPPPESRSTLPGDLTGQLIDRADISPRKNERQKEIGRKFESHEAA
jgi:hypothetical protein